MVVFDVSFLLVQSFIFLPGFLFGDEISGVLMGELSIVCM